MRPHRMPVSFDAPSTVWCLPLSYWVSFVLHRDNADGLELRRMEIFYFSSCQNLSLTIYISRHDSNSNRLLLRNLCLQCCSHRWCVSSIKYGLWSSKVINCWYVVRTKTGRKMSKGTPPVNSMTGQSKNGEMLANVSPTFVYTTYDQCCLAKFECTYRTVLSPWIPFYFRKIFLF